MDTKIEFAKRPKINPNLRKEQMITLTSNYMEMSFTNFNKKVKQYSINIEPEVDVRNSLLLKKIMKNIREEMNEKLSPYFYQDFILLSLINTETPELNFTSKVDEKEYNVKIKMTRNEINLRNINQSDDLENIKIKNLIELLIKRALRTHKGMIRIGRNGCYNYMNKNVFFENKFALLTGFETSANILTKGIYMRVSPSYKLLNLCSALAKMNEISQKYRNGSLKPKIRDTFLKKSIVANYGKHRSYLIDDISFEANVKNTFVTIRKNNEKIQISLFQYYLENYNIEIKDKLQPLFIHKSRDGSVQYLVPELCNMTGLDEESFENENLKREILRNTKNTPSQKIAKMEEIKNYFKTETNENQPNTKDDFLNICGLQPKDFLSCRGRVLPPPEIKFKNEKYNFGNNLDRKIRLSMVIDPKDFSRNDTVLITSKHLYSNAKNIIDKMKAASKQMGIGFDSDITIITVDRDRSVNDYINNLKDKYEHILKKSKNILVYLDYKQKSFYKLLKDYLTLYLKLPSQFMNPKKNIKEMNLSYFSGVLNGLLNKSGGTLFKTQFSNFIYDSCTMLIGFHTKKAENDSIYLSMASTYNYYFSKHYTLLKKCQKKEMKEELNEMIRKSVDNFIYKNNDPNTTPRFVPRLILLFRDGGNQHDQEKYKKDEIPEIEKSLNSLTEIYKSKGIFKENESIKLVYVVVNKKTDAKFFEKRESNNRDNGYNNNYRGNYHRNDNRNNGLEYCNPGSGTCVDTDIVNENEYEFYIQPQFVPNSLGTATPVHFTVLRDSMNIPIEELEKTIYNTTFMYSNWTGPITVPSVVKHAEKHLAYVVKYFNGRGPNSNYLASRPFYI